MKTTCRIIGLSIISIVFTGCATVAYRANATFPTYFATTKKVAIMPVDIKMNKLTAGGMHELVDEWSAQANAAMLSALTDQLRVFPTIMATPLQTTDMPSENKNLLRQQNGLFNTVAYSIITHTYIPNSIFPQKKKNFDYTLGADIAHIQKITGDADAILFCSGQNYIWTSGRVSLALFGALIGAATGVQITIPAGPEWIVASLIDMKTGDVIWFNFIPMPGDMRIEEIDTRIAHTLFKNFPAEWKE